MDTAIIAALITAIGAAAGSLAVAILNHRLQESVREEKHRVKKQQEDIDEISFIITRLISKFEHFFLNELGKRSDYRFKNSFRDKDHLRRLYDLELIDKTDKLANIADLKQGDILSDKLRILPAGETYLKLRERVLQQAA
ncbi:MAG: hypothetical protein GY807_01365 [Gammaproteobacteria bacterium]|nr:hypothetical protein [Gammaproteobacteria bacterium]